MTPAPSGKAIDGLRPEMPAREAARLTLKGRLRAVERMLEQATGGGELDDKSVHRLRVSTRRASASMRAYEGWTTKKDRKRVAKMLRRIRRTAADARLCDVQLIDFGRLLRDVGPALAPPIAFVMGRIGEQRREAGRAVAALVDDPRCGRACVKRLRRRVVEGIEKGSGDASLMELATQQVPRLVRQMDEAGRADLTDLERVHQLRIAGKRLRYAVEVFECCFAPEAHETLLDRLTRFQDHLGAINDLCDMKARVDAFVAEGAPSPELGVGLERLSQELAAQLRAAHTSFLEWWSGEGVGGMSGGGGGVGSIIGGLDLPGLSPAPQEAAPGHANGKQNGELGAAMDRLIEDAVRHLA